MLIEICANSFESARNAQLAGAHRIELCSELGLGGITPSHGLLKKVVEELEIPVHVLIRPRSGNFTYTESEFDVMKRDVEFCKELGCQGVVSGLLRSDNTIDVDRTRELKLLAGEMNFSFHRAFDWVPDPFAAVRQLAEIGCYGLLTSGQQDSAIKGLDLLKQLTSVQDEMVVMPGGGVNAGNILTFKQEGFKEIHFSATILNKVMENPPELSMNSTRFLDETVLAVSGYDIIKNMVSIVK